MLSDTGEAMAGAGPGGARRQSLLIGKPDRVQAGDFQEKRVQVLEGCGLVESMHDVDLFPVCPGGADRRKDPR
jgi:hypothetical protein